MSIVTKYFKRSRFCRNLVIQVHFITGGTICISRELCTSLSSSSMIDKFVNLSWSKNRTVLGRRGRNAHRSYIRPILLVILQGPSETLRNHEVSRDSSVFRLLLSGLKTICHDCTWQWTRKEFFISWFMIWYLKLCFTISKRMGGDLYICSGLRLEKERTAYPLWIVRGRGGWALLKGWPCHSSYMDRSVIC